MNEPHGLVLVLTGPGKGKTTSALGATLRAAGQGLKIHFIQFIKSGSGYGEAAMLERLPGVKFTALGLGLIGDDPDLEPHRERAQLTLEAAHQALTSGQWDMVVLDELCVGLSRGLVTLAQVLELLALRPPRVHIIITGRNCPAEILAAADTVTHLEDLRHHLRAGVPAQPGVEF